MQKLTYSAEDLATFVTIATIANRTGRAHSAVRYALNRLRILPDIVHPDIKLYHPSVVQTVNLSMRRNNIRSRVHGS